MKKMKKLLAGFMAATMVMSMSVTAFADEATGDADGGEATTTTTYTDMSTATLTKEYKLTNPNTTSPAETFSFSALKCTDVKDAGVGVTKENAPIPTIANVSYEAGAAGGANARRTITLTLPTYTSVGIYTYTFNETDGNTAGVTYRSEEIKLVVTVLQDATNGKIRVAALHTEDEDGQKSAEFNNTYSAGSLSIKKNVTGILGDQQKEFTVKVTFTAPDGDTVKEAINYTDDGKSKSIAANWTGTTNAIEITLKHDETVTFTNIPYGVTYTVVENNYTDEADGGYDAASYNFDDTNKKIDTVSENVTITNNKDGEVDTGISLDNMPYIMVLALVALGLVGFVSKKRSMEF